MISVDTPDGDDYFWKTDPFTHQREVFYRSRDRHAFGLLMGMGTGKSKVICDTAAWNFQMGRINCLLIVAPNGVHRNWTKEGGEVELHMPDWTHYKATHWVSPSLQLKRHRDALEEMFDPEFVGLRVIAMNIEAFARGTTEDVCTKEGRKLYWKERGVQHYTAHGFVKKLCNTFNVLMVVDESSKIKTPGAKQTRNLITLGTRATMRRILTGTPVTNGPMDCFSQFKFLDRDDPLLGFDNFTSFRNHFAVLEQVRFRHNGRDVEFEEIKGYKNIDELTALVDEHSFRITKEECLDLPDKLFTQRFVEITPKQRKLYNDIITRSLLEFEDQEDELLINNVLTRLLRLQQVLGGFVPREEFGDALPIEDKNPRIDCLMDCLEETDSKVIIWARFRPEIAAIEDALREKYGKEAVVSYHGGVDNDTREINVNRFQNDDTCRYFVGQQHSGGYGLTLHAATTVIYFSNDFSLEARLQSEDRAHRIGQHHNVTYIDIECLGTVDTKIINALRHKQDLAELITRDNYRQLLAKAA